MDETNPALQGWNMQGHKEVGMYLEATSNHRSYSNDEFWYKAVKEDISDATQTK